MTNKSLIATILLTASLASIARADITTGLVGYWNLSEGSGSTAADTSGSSPANNGTLTGFADTSFTAMWTTNGWLNDAVTFNQSGETGNYLSVPDSTSLDFSGTAAFTLSAWVNMSVTPSGQGPILMKGTSGSTLKDSWALDFSGNKFDVAFRNTSGGTRVTCAGTTVPTKGKWYHVVGTYGSGQSPNKLQLYVNGVAEGTPSQNNIITVNKNTHALSIGNRDDGTGAYNLPFKGTIDEVRIYNRTLTPGDVFQLYTNNAPIPVFTTQPRNVNCYSNDTAVFSVSLDPRFLPPAAYQWYFNNGSATTAVTGATNTILTLPGVTNANAGSYNIVVSNLSGIVTSAIATLSVRSLPAADTTTGRVGWWKLDDGSGSSTAADASGNGNAGLLANFTDTTYTTQWGAGIINGALTFNGDASGFDVVAVPSIGNPAPSVLDFNASPAFTLSAWVNATLASQTGSENGIITKGTGGGGEQYCLELNSGTYRFYVRDTNGVTYNITSAVAVNGVWQHVAAVLNAANGLMNLYVNGVLAGSAVAPSSLLAASHEVSFGNRQSSTAGYDRPFTGALDDVRIYSRDLTAADVFALYGQAALPFIVTQYPVTYTNLFTLYAGASPTFKLAAITGLTPLSYQWYRNGASVPGATASTYQPLNLPAGGFTAFCVVTNSLGAATSYVWTASVVAAPTAPYAQSVQGLNPLGYWRLDEPDDTLFDGNPGDVAHDYFGGNDGIYTNTYLGQLGYAQGLANQYAYSPATDPETSALFGYFGATDNDALNIAGVDFSGTTGTSRCFSIAAWVNGAPTQVAGAGIVAKGYSGAEQFDLDVYGTGTSKYFRFLVRDAAGAIHGPTSTFATDGNWHHLVGVCDETNALVTLYVDGVSVGQTSIGSTGGILSSTLPMSIGARRSSATSTYNWVFNGNINDVAIYGYALTAAQVKSNYLAAGLPPFITQAPVTSTNVNEGTTLVVPAQISAASSPLATQWFTNGVPVPGQTSNTLTIPNISAAAWNGQTATLTVTNPYGSASASVYITVNNGAPVVTIGPSAATVYSNMPVTFRASATGTEPFAYQWSTNGIAVPGATAPTYTAIARLGTDTITCTITGSGSGSASATLTGIALPTDAYALGILADAPMAYWRLNEARNATVAHDCVGAHDAAYNNATNGLPGPSGNPNMAAGFGMNGVTSDSYALEQSGGVLPIDFSTMGTNASFSVEAWFKGPSPQTGGIVTKGSSNNEQFNLDFNNNHFRFRARDATGAVHGPESAINPDGLWHHLVGIYNSTNGLMTLFVDGVVQGTATNTPGLAVLPSAYLTSIGARRDTATGLYDIQCLSATIDEVAIYGYALSTNQVVTHYSNVTFGPQFAQDLPAQVYAYAGFPMSFGVVATTNNPPITYQWRRSGVNLVDGGAITGSHSNILSLGIAQFADSGETYQVFITNSATSIPAASTLATLTVLSNLGFNGFGNQWTSQGNLSGIPTYTAPNVLQLIDGGANEISSSYFSYPVYVGGFLATYTYQAGGNKKGDGVAFVLQNDSRGAAALGTGGSGLGFGGVTNSASIQFNIYTAGRTVGYAYKTNGLSASYTSTTPVNFASGDPINVTLLYANGVLTMTLVDAVTAASFTATANDDIVGAVGGDTAYVGFSAADSGSTATHTISNFSFISLPMLSIQAAPAGDVTLTWPESVGVGFRLQASPSLDPSGWTNITTAPTNVGGFYQVIRSASDTSLFYRLITP